MTEKSAYEKTIDVFFGKNRKYPKKFSIFIKQSFYFFEKKFIILFSTVRELCKAEDSRNFRRLEKDDKERACTGSNEKRAGGYDSGWILVSL